MIRLSIFWALVAFVAVYTWRDWFRGLCGLIMLVAILEMPDVPKAMFGIDGLNFFNLLLVNVAAAWVVARYRENLKFDLPPHIATLLLIYLAIVVIGFFRLWENRVYMIQTYASTETTGSMIREYLINTLKWVMPGVMLYDGCRTRERTIIALLSITVVYLFLGAMVVKVMPLSAALLSGDELQRLALRLLGSRTGYHRVNLSMMLAGASWAVLALRGLTSDKRLHLLAIVASICVLYAQTLTGGRAGYAAWAATGLILCAFRWRLYLLATPILVLAIFIFMPSVSDRILFGITQDEFTSNITLNDYDLTSGRVIIWPLVIDKIHDGPLIGFGRVAMWSTGIVVYTALILTEDFGHPHNAYLEWILDNGIVGFIPLMAFYAVVLFHALRVFCDRRSGLFMAAGGMAAALVLGLMTAAMGSQTFYPVEGTVGMWCAIAVMFRLSVNRTQAIARIKAATSPVMAFGHAVPPAPLPAAAAAAEMEEHLFRPRDQFEVDWRSHRKRPSAPAATPPRPEPAARQASLPQPHVQAERPASVPRFVFGSEEVTRR